MAKERTRKFGKIITSLTTDEKKSCKIDDFLGLISKKIENSYTLFLHFTGPQFY